MNTNKMIALVVAAAASALSLPALAGSIVINAYPEQPTRPLSYVEGNRTVELGVTWREVSLASKVKGYIRRTYGRDLPYSIDGNRVLIIVDANGGQIDSVSTSQL